MEDGQREEDPAETLPAPDPALGDEEDEEYPGVEPELPLNDQDRVLLVLSYLGVLALVPFLTAKKEFVLWHARQGLLLFGVSLVTLFCMVLVNVILWHLAWILGLLFLVLFLTTGFGILALVVACILKALEGERWKIPGLGDFVDRI